jgi:hypothetical protein
MSSVQDSEQDGTEPRYGGIDGSSQSAARSGAGSGFFGSRRKTGLSADDGSSVEHVTGSVRHLAMEPTAAHGSRGVRNRPEADETRSLPAAGDINSRTVFDRFGGDAAARRSPYNELRLASAKIDAERQKVDPATTLRVPVRPAHTSRRRAQAAFNRIAAAVAACFVLAIGMLVYGALRGPVHLTSPVPIALPGEEAIWTEWGARAEHGITSQYESVPAIPSIHSAQEPAAAKLESTIPAPLKEVTGRAAPRDDGAIVSEPVEQWSSPATVQSGVADAVAGRVTDIAAACSTGGVALGLCPSQAGQAQPATETSSSTDLARWPKDEPASGHCNKAVVALGLCAQ